MLGDIRQDGGLGTGLIPLDNIVGKPAMARGIDSFVDSITIRREDGGRAVIRQKTGEMERRAWQGEAVDAAWLDEDFGDDSVYGEVLARLVTTAGIVVVGNVPNKHSTRGQSHAGTGDAPVLRPNRSSGTRAL